VVRLGGWRRRGREGGHKACPYRSLRGKVESAVCMGVRGQGQGVAMPGCKAGVMSRAVISLRELSNATIAEMVRKCIFSKAHWAT